GEDRAQVWRRGVFLHAVDQQAVDIERDQTRRAAHTATGRPVRSEIPAAARASRAARKLHGKNARNVRQRDLAERLADALPQLGFRHEVPEARVSPLLEPAE